MLCILTSLSSVYLHWLLGAFCKYTDILSRYLHFIPHGSLCVLQIPKTPDGKLELAESLISHNYNSKTHQLNSILTNSQYKPIETSGRSKWNDNKIFVSDPKHTPKLAHIQLEVSARQHSKPDQRLTILALHDSGCAKSVTNTILIGLLNRNDLPKPIKHFDTNCLPLLKM